MNPLIEFNNISFNYELTEALFNINLKIYKGDSIALIGSNGSGKSTLLKIINGIYFVKQGEYIYDGNIITEKAMKNSSFSKLFHKISGEKYQGGIIINGILVGGIRLHIINIAAGA